MPHSEIVKQYYTRNLLSHNDYRALGWETAEAQGKRFQALTDNVRLNNKSLLDVGCGLGDLFGFLKATKVSASYLGIDILPEMITGAKAKYPDGVFIHDDLFERQSSDPIFPENSFDVIFCSGLFNLNTSESTTLLRKALLTFQELAKEKIVFNLLSCSSPNKEDTYCYHDPRHIEKMLRSLRFHKDKIRFIDGYLENDFTVVVNL